MTNLSSLDYVENFTISKTVSDRAWRLSAVFDKSDAPRLMMGVRAFATDYADVEHCLFVGFIPGRDYILDLPNNKVSITAYDFSWYLTAQHLAGKGFIYEEYTDVNYDTIDGVISGVINETGLSKGANINLDSDFNIRYTWPPDKIAQQTITELEEDCDMQFIVFLDKSGDVYTPKAYFLKEAEIDTYVPAKVTFINPSDYVIKIVKNENGLEDYNRVIVYGTDPLTGAWYKKTEEIAAVTNGETNPIEYFYMSPRLDTQAKTDAKALSLYYSLYQISPYVYTATLTNRYDLRLFQTVSFSGYDNIFDGTMRIIGISYNRTPTNDTVTITCTWDQSYTTSRLLARHLSDDVITTTQQVAEDVVNRGVPNLQVGEVTDVSGNVAIVTIERTDNIVQARILD